MSADNYYRVTKTPDGKFAAMMGFMSDPEEPFYQEGHHQTYDTFKEAYDWANSQYAEYGIYVDSVCFNRTI